MMTPSFSSRILVAVAMATILGWSATAVAAPDLEAAKKKAQEVCAACHGLDGISPVADFPKLAGQYPDYLAKALRDYKSGARKNAVMAGFAQGLTQKDIDNLSAYYASQPSVLSSKY